MSRLIIEFDLYIINVYCISQKVQIQYIVVFCIFSAYFSSNCIKEVSLYSKFVFNNYNFGCKYYYKCNNECSYNCNYKNCL